MGNRLMSEPLNQLGMYNTEQGGYDIYPLGADAANIKCKDKDNSNSNVQDTIAKLSASPDGVYLVEEAIEGVKKLTINTEKVITSDYADESLAPKAHNASTLEYGGGTATDFGHIKLSDRWEVTTTDAGVAAMNSVGASSLALQQVYLSLLNKINNIKVFKDFDLVLAPNQTTLELVNEAVTDEAIIDIYTDTYGVEPLTVTTTPAVGGGSGTIKMEFVSREVQTKVKVRIS